MKDNMNIDSEYFKVEKDAMKKRIAEKSYTVKELEALIYLASLVLQSGQSRTAVQIRHRLNLHT